MSGTGSQPTYTSSQLTTYTIAFEGNSVACILYGVYLVIAGTNLYLLRKREHRFLLLYSILQLVLATVYVVMSLYTAPATSLSIFNITNAYSLVALSPWSAIVVNVAYALNMWISDAFLLYRCYVVCQGNKVTLALPFLLYFATVGSSLAWLIISSYPGAVYSTHDVQVTGICYWSCSVAMNVCASCFISVRLGMHRRVITKALGSHHGQFYLGYMAMTLESALLYTAFVIVALVVLALNSPLMFVFLPVSGMMQAIAPSLIIYRIARGFSFSTDQFGSLAIASIQFATSDRMRESPQLFEDKSNGSTTSQATSGNAKPENDSSNSIVHEVQLQV